MSKDLDPLEDGYFNIILNVNGHIEWCRSSMSLGPFYDPIEIATRVDRVHPDRSTVVRFDPLPYNETVHKLLSVARRVSYERILA